METTKTVIRKEMDENTWCCIMWRNVIIALLVFFGSCFYACDRRNVREMELRKTMPLVETCVTHYPIDSVKGGTSQ